MWFTVAAVAVEHVVPTLPDRIAFGSCSDQWQPKPVLDVAIASDPDLFVFLGDNVYADTSDMDVMRRAYGALGTSPEFVRLRAKVPLVATWDDHDYGRDDIGSGYPQKEASRAIFLDFWQEPAESPRRAHDGVYTSYRFEQGGKRLQLILLDERTWRSTPADPKDPAQSMLGEAQWAWLAAELDEPADLRVIGSSTQFAHARNGFESWTDYPRERERMIELLRAKSAGVLFISGDLHIGEISKLPLVDGHALWDVTSSGINESWPEPIPNVNRVGDPVRDHNYGYLDMDWNARLVSFGLVDVTGAVRASQSLGFDALAWPSRPATPPATP